MKDSTLKGLGQVGKFAWRERAHGGYEVFDTETQRVLSAFLYEEDAEADAIRLATEVAR